MPIKLPSLKIFSAAGARSRVLMVFTVLAGVILGIFTIIHYFGSPPTTGASSVATVPNGLQSVPGGQTSPEYSRAIIQANAAASKQAAMTGGSAVHTLINVPGQTDGFPQQNCTVLCPNENNVNVADDLETLAKQGKLSQENADRLMELAQKSVPIEEFADNLNELIKQGKLTPEQARTILEKYKKQQANVLLTNSGKWMDCMIKEGQMPIDTANQLLILQKSNITPANYASELNALAQEGKFPADSTLPLLAQYTQQQSAEKAKEVAFTLQQMTKSGQITAEVASQLNTLQNNKVSTDQYKIELNRLISTGKMIPATAIKLLQDYQTLHEGTGTTEVLNSLIEEEKTKYSNLLNNEIKNSKLSQETAGSLFTLLQSGANKTSYENTLMQLVKAEKLSTDQARKLDETYQRYLALLAQIQRLVALQNNNVSLDTYTNELKNAIKAGMITPATAASLIRLYQALNIEITTPTENSCVGVITIIPESSNIAGIATTLPQSTSTIGNTALAGSVTVPDIETNIPSTLTSSVSTPSTESPESAEEAKAQQAKAIEDQQQRIQQLQTAMAAQATQLVAAWQQVPIMQHKEGARETTKPETGSTSGKSTSARDQAEKTNKVKKVLIKAGTILFALLDTSVDSDYPDTPVMATIVMGDLKGAKLLGKLNLAKDQDKISLNFQLMNTDNWPTSRPINAFAIDPNTARTVMASHVDYHYLKRYGSIMATSFLTGYSNAITEAGTSTTGIFGTSTDHPNLSPGNKIAVGLGQIGTTLSNSAAAYFNTPNTVKIDSGVGLGILFMADMTE